MSGPEDRDRLSSGDPLWSGGDPARNEPAPSDAPAPELGGWLPPSGEPAQGAVPSSPATPGWSAPQQGSYAAWPGEQASEAAGLRPAGYMERVGAAVIDFFVRLALLIAGIVLAAAVSGGTDTAMVAGGLVGYVAGLAYAPIMMSRTPGQTLGHKVVSTRIVKSATGIPATGGHAVLREVLVKWLLIDAIGGTILIPTIVNYLWPLWDDKNEALHDKICSTRVVEA